MIEDSVDRRSIRRRGQAEANHPLGKLALAQAAAAELCTALRPDAVALADSWDFPDRILNSVLGRHDGNIYEAIFKASVISPLNRKEVPRFLQAFEPNLDKDFLALNNAMCEEALLDEEADEDAGSPQSKL